jgi:hypothetical protein
VFLLSRCAGCLCRGVQPSAPPTLYCRLTYQLARSTFRAARFVKLRLPFGVGTGDDAAQASAPEVEMEPEPEEAEVEAEVAEVSVHCRVCSLGDAKSSLGDA